MIEVERKFRLDDSKVDEVWAAIFEGNGELKQSYQTDEVFMRDGDSYETFAVGQPVIRLRAENDTTELTYKRTINPEGDSVEHEVMVGDAAIMKLMLGEMGYQHVTTVRKQRVTASLGALSFMLDKVEHLGNFLEIERVVDTEEQVPEAEFLIMISAGEIGLGDSDIEVRKYDYLTYMATKNDK